MPLEFVPGDGCAVVVAHLSLVVLGKLVEMSLPLVGLGILVLCVERTVVWIAADVPVGLVLFVAVVVLATLVGTIDR